MYIGLSKTPNKALSCLLLSDSDVYRWPSIDTEISVYYR